MAGNGKRMGLCVVLSLLLCLAHIRGSTVLLFACLVGFMALMAYACIANFSFPVLLYFIPWSPILRTDPTSFSFYTFALVMVCAISVLKKKFCFKRYHVAIGMVLIVVTLLSKLLDGIFLSFDYVAFMMLILVFPVVKEEWKAGGYGFYQIVVYFSVGIIVAALCAMNFAPYANIAQFIRIDAYLTVIRRSGFYGDANFYSAQITAAIGGCLVGLLKEKKRFHTVILFVILVLLLYCGFLSGSKSFVLVTLVMVLLWLIGLLRLQGRGALKIMLILATVLVAVFIATSELFRELIEVLATRFSFRANISDFTTGRTELWRVYAEELLSDWKTLFFGKGFTNIKINDRGSHNTIIQMIFQFGLLGTPILAGWIVCFFMDAPQKATGRRIPLLHVLLLLVGTFAPWLAIDALFFDEFFLLQMYVYLGLRWMSGQERLQPIKTDTAEPTVS